MIICLAIVFLNGLIFVMNPIVIASLRIDILFTTSLGGRNPSQIRTWVPLLAVYVIIAIVIPVVCLIVYLTAEPCAPCAGASSTIAAIIAVLMAIGIQAFGAGPFNDNAEFESEEKFISFAAPECLENETVGEVTDCERVGKVYERSQFIGLEVMITSISFVILGVFSAISACLAADGVKFFE
jgi:hypothetical protein